MKTFNFDEIISREGTCSMKWNLEEYFPDAPSDCLPYWIADMEFACADPILEALHKRIDQKILGYTAFYDAEYFEAVQHWFERRHGLTIPRESIFFSPGVVPAIVLLMRVLTRAGEGVIIQQPAYNPFMVKTRANGRQLVVNPLVETDGYYTIDYEGLERCAADPDNHLLLFCNPHNPTGRVWNPEELRKVADICKRHDVTIISDEIHCDLVRGQVTYHPMEKICPEYKDRIITCLSPSKTFNLAGMHLSNIIIHDPAIRRAWLREIDTKGAIGVPNPLAVTAAAAAYNECEEWLAALLQYLDDNLTYLKDFLAKELPLIKFSIPEGTYLAWLDLRAYGMQVEEQEAFMLQKAHLIFDEGYIFGHEGVGFERINVACPRALLEQGMLRLKAALN
ncbi:MalY/PatB family protein [Diplocloster modestus]|uniref:cysteine-S-conjugate beta-lyase n=1 Tax=Diplocloster modestus TaxID=2850322 RepID=A0ABS6K4R1_9FIRM|nr:pyridoxal phosphate-dependent aminotransferase [Diplocloster modestus]